jgi:hypothetical protein
MANEPRRFQQELNWYLSLGVVFLLIIVPPMLCGLFYLSQVPELTWQRNDGLTFDRIWLYRERRPQGIGYQRARVVAEYSPTEVCVENRLRFLLWAKSTQTQPATTRYPMVRSDGGWQATGEDCR